MAPARRGKDDIYVELRKQLRDRLAKMTFLRQAYLKSEIETLTLLRTFATGKCQS